jgi:hypothetical protein
MIPMTLAYHQMDKVFLSYVAMFGKVSIACLIVAGYLTAAENLQGNDITPRESLWIEAEHLNGIQGYCWPMGRPEMKKTSGHWGLSGPGWAAEWCQGGESGFLSIATSAEDDQARASKEISIPIDGTYYVWVRYGDWREKSEKFQIVLEQEGITPSTLYYGDHPVVEEDNEMKLYFDWAFGWDRQVVELKKGDAKLHLQSRDKQLEPRQVDVIVLTTDASYRPLVKQRPWSASRQILEQYRQVDGSTPRSAEQRQTKLDGLEPLAKRQDRQWMPAQWNLRTFQDRGFLYLWNMSHTSALDTWLSDKPERVQVPYNVADADVRMNFEKKYSGQKEVPIFSDPRIVPLFHGVGAGIFATDKESGKVLEVGERFSKWLDQNPGRFWGMMMNYHPGVPIGEEGIARFEKYRDRYVGSIAGESLGYFYPDPELMKKATDSAKSRRELVQAMTPIMLEENRKKYQAVYGRDIDSNPYRDVISCLSVGNILGVPLCADWGAATVGYESSAATSSLLSMRWAFLRGISRQRGVLTATYRSCNFGDSSTIFSDTQSYHGPKNFYDNFYSVISGAGMTWYKMDLWYQYMAGASMFYHEQGFDEYWQPGGTTAAGVHDIELSPKGKLVDRFLRATAKEPERGVPITPVAFLVDFAHGWEPAPFWPNSFKNWHGHSDRFLHSDHEQMLEQYFWNAYHPIVASSEQPMTATSEVYVPGVFGDIFDVIYAYPDVSKWTTIDSYPVVVVTGEIDLTEAEGVRLAEYVQRGGTLVVAANHLTGPGVAQLQLPSTTEVKESDGYRWLARDEHDEQKGNQKEVDLGESLLHRSQRFRYLPWAQKDLPGMRKLATTNDGDLFCGAIDRGEGRLIYLSVPHGLGIDRQSHPVVTRLIAHLSRGLMPLEVAGDVEWLVNRTSRGLLVTLLNPAGQDKPQHGITPTDYRENRSVSLRSFMPISNVRDRLSPADKIEIKDNRIDVVVPAGGVRILEIQ